MTMTHPLNITVYIMRHFFRWFFLAALTQPHLLHAENMDSRLAFHFDFKNANGKKELLDETSSQQCFSEAPLKVEDGALHIDYGAKIFIPAEKLPDTSKDFTLSVWVAVSKQSVHGIQQYHPILTKGLYNQKLDFDLALQDMMPIFFFSSLQDSAFRGINVIGHVYGSTTRYPDKSWIKAPPEIEEAKWTQLAAVSHDGKFSIYKNGKLVLENTTPIKPIPPTLEPLFIGAERITEESDNRSSAHLLLNDLRMYSGALSPEEVADLYQSEAGKYPTGKVAISWTNNYWSQDMAEFNYDLENKLPFVESYEKSIPADPYTSAKSLSVKVGTGARTGSVLVNNQPHFPLASYPAVGYVKEQSLTQTKRFITDFAAAGIDFTTICFSRPIFWTGEKNFDWSKVDEAFNAAIAANPKVQIMASFYLAPPEWFVKSYPDEMEKYYYNDEDLAAGLRSWPNSAPLASQKWADFSCSAVQAFVQHIESQPYASHIYGYLIPSGDAGEWYWPAAFTGGMSGYSQPTTEGFRTWLRKHYPNESDLRLAWSNQSVTFATATPPPPALRKASERWIFRDRKASRQVFDFRAYMGDTTFALLKRTLETAKEACGWKKLISTYYGYPLLYAGKGATLQKGGIQDLGKVFRLNSIDVLTSPVDYVKRRGGQPGMNINGFYGSARLHEKQVWREEDLRTHFWPRFEYGRTSNTAETLGVITRDFGQALTNSGSGLWYTAMAGNAAYHQTAIMERFSAISKTAATSLHENRQSIARAAIIFDEKSLSNLAVQSGGFIDDHCWGVYENASMSGTPFDLYLTDDIDQMPDYKMYVFVNAYELDPELVEKIKMKVRKNNAVSVWCYAPGYISQDGFDASQMASLTGIDLKEDLRQATGKLVPIQSASPILKYAGEMKSYKFGPLFKVVDPKANILGSVLNQPALASKEFGKPGEQTSWRSVYSLMPLNKELLMGLCDYADIPVYSRSFDVFGINKSYAVLHAVQGGEKTLNFPEKVDIYDALGQELVAKDTHNLVISLAQRETRLFRLSPASSESTQK